MFLLTFVKNIVAFVRLWAWTSLEGRVNLFGPQFAALKFAAM